MGGVQFPQILGLLLVVFACTAVGRTHGLPERQATACPSQPAGQGPMPTPDTADAFNTLQDFSALASNASAPTGYIQTFRDLNASCSNVELGSVGYALLPAYDAQACTSKCDQTYGCVAANLYFERAPTVQIDPTIGCDNLDPASTTLIKCAFWAHATNASVTTDYGEAQYNFQVAIRGSNGYVKDTAMPELQAVESATSSSTSTNATASATVSGSAAVTASPIPTASSSSTVSASTSLRNPGDKSMPAMIAAFYLLCGAIVFVA